MKKDFTNRTGHTNSEVKKEIEAWIRKPNKNDCPFGILTCRTHSSVLCSQVFPRVRGNSCPCRLYSFPYVIRVAKQAIKALE